MAYNVCRPITLYNDFLPSGKKPHKDWDYLAFGYFDGIKVGEENLFINNQCSMECIWDYDMHQTENLQGTYSQQTIYGFRAGDDTEFWREAKREETEYPFLFVVLLQNKIDESKSAIERRIEIEKGLSLNGKRKAITYLTLDNSGMVMIFMCRTYADGASIIDSFHRDKNQEILKDLGVELSYSFTVAAVQKRFISGDDIRKLNACKLKSAYIYGIEKYPGSIEVIYNKVKDILKDSSVEKESVLGCNDEVIVIKDASWTEFLELYRDSTGVLNHSSLEYNSSVIGLTTIITQEQNGFESAGNMVGGINPENDQTLSQIMRTRIQQKDSWNQKAGSTYLNRYLYQVINALQKFENMIIPDYVFCSMFLPIDMVLDIAENVTEDVEKSFVKCFHEFVKGLNLCIQNSIRSDRQFTQSLAFDIQIYSTPVRLNAFYNAFIYYIKNFLQWLGGQSSVRHRYEFLASVGVTDKIQVYELFKNISRENRAFLVSIPENQIYDMRLMLITLGHEVGHFVGRLIKNRKYRFECAIRITVKITSSYFVKKLKEKYDYYGEKFLYEQDEKFWNKFERQLEEYLKNYLVRLEEPEYLKKTKFANASDEELKKACELYKEYKYYTHVFRETIVDGVNSILSEKRDELFGYLQEMEYLNYVENEIGTARKKRELMKLRILEVSKEITGYSVWEKAHLSIVTAVDRMIVIFKESQADLIDILTLKLPLKDYLWAIKKSISEQTTGQKEFSAEVIIRSGLVTCCMFYKEDGRNLGYGWSDNELWALSELHDDVLNEMAENICDFKDNFFSVETKKKIPNSMKWTIDIFGVEGVLEPFLNYLVKCREGFESYIQKFSESEDFLNIQKRLQDMYRLCNQTNIESLIWEMQESIETYRKILQDEMRETLNKNLRDGNGKNDR